MDKLREDMKTQSNQQAQMEVLRQGSQIIQNMGGIDSYGSDLLARFGIV